MSHISSALLGILLSVVSFNAFADCSKNYWKETTRAHLQFKTPFSDEERTALTECIHSQEYGTDGVSAKEQFQRILDSFPPSKAPAHVVGPEAVVEVADKKSGY